MRFIVLIAAILNCAVAIAQEQIAIGAVLPLSGDVRVFGEEGRMALEHALADAKPQRFKYKLVFEDDQLNAAKAVAAAQKLAEIDQVQAVFSQWSYGGHAVGSKLKGREIFNLAFAWDKAILDYGPNNYIVAPPPDQLTEKVAAKIAQSSAKKIWVVSFAEAGVKQMMDAFEISAREEQLNIERRIEITPAELNGIASLVTKIKAAKPDYLVLSLLLPQYLELFRQMRLQQFDIPMISIGQTPRDEKFRGAAPKSWLTIDYIASPERDQEIQKRTGLQGTSGYPAYYDGMRALIAAYEATPKDSKPTFQSISAGLDGYKNPAGYLGSISFGNRRIISDQAIFVDAGAMYEK